MIYMKYTVCPECKNKGTLDHYKLIEETTVACPKCKSFFDVGDPNVVNVENEYYSIDIKILIVNWKHSDFKYIDANTIEVGGVKFEGTLEFIDPDETSGCPLPDGRVIPESPHPMVFAADDQDYWFMDGRCFYDWVLTGGNDEETTFIYNAIDDELRYICDKTEEGFTMFGNSVPDGAGHLIEYTLAFDCHLDKEGDIDFDTATLVSKITQKITQL